MNEPIDRRVVLRGVALGAVAGFAAGVPDLAQAKGLVYGPAEPFSFEALQARARAAAQAPYQGPAKLDAAVLERIDYDAWGKIGFDMDQAVFADGPGRFPLSFFHLGKFFQKPVEIAVVDGATARPLIYDPSYFDMPADSPGRLLPKGAGFAGLRIQEPRDGTLDWRRNDWVAFLGASYFRAIGELYQYGLSARGIALDIAIPDRPEEFPDYTRMWIGPEEGDTVTLHALMEGPSIVGAYKFVMTRTKAVLMDIEQHLFLRRDVARFGIAPCTSMYWFSETAKGTAVDWRPEVHDSDGLSLWTGFGEHLWRPLNNPPRIMASAFSDDSPKGFGLLQRDRVFDHYGDGVLYDRRPSLWVEPVGSWGRGAVQLVEIPTDDEIHDNIVAMWVPETPAKAGTEHHFRYKLHWTAEEPFPTPLARVVATRLGNGGQPGQPRPRGVRKFLVEFLGGPLVDVPFGVKPEQVITASRGTIGAYALTEAVPDGVAGHWRTQFDLAVDGADPVELKLALTLGGKVATETWVFQYHPF